MRHNYVIKPDKITEMTDQDVHFHQRNLNQPVKPCTKKLIIKEHETFIKSSR